MITDCQLVVNDYFKMYLRNNSRWLRGIYYENINSRLILCRLEKNQSSRYIMLSIWVLVY